jgi:hypothetical protein
MKPLPPNKAVELTAGSRALAAAAHRQRWADNSRKPSTNV